jgi:D-alanyl-lipoteichoic acid acyltransferase DltB (MBOAT superfamily)
MKKFFITISAFLTPMVAFAQATHFGQVNSWVEEILLLANKGVVFLMVLATLYFIWIVIGLMTEKDAKARTEKKAQLTWAVIGLAIMVSVWGIIKFATNTLGISTTTPGQGDISVPCPIGTHYIDATIGCR